MRLGRRRGPQVGSPAADHSWILVTQAAIQIQKFTFIMNESEAEFNCIVMPRHRQALITHPVGLLAGTVSITSCSMARPRGGFGSFGGGCAEAAE